MEQLYVITRKNNIINYIKNIYYIILTMNIDEIITKNKILEEELQKTNINLADKIIIIIYNHIQSIIIRSKMNPQSRIYI